VENNSEQKCDGCQLPLETFWVKGTRGKKAAIVAFTEVGCSEEIDLLKFPPSTMQKGKNLIPIKPGGL
jgi:hypothetical protein